MWHLALRPILLMLIFLLSRNIALIVTIERCQIGRLDKGCVVTVGSIHFSSAPYILNYVTCASMWT